MAKVVGVLEAAGVGRAAGPVQSSSSAGELHSIAESALNKQAAAAEAATRRAEAATKAMVKQQEEALNRQAAMAGKGKSFAQDSSKGASKGGDKSKKRKSDKWFVKQRADKAGRQGW